ncbi:MAG: hypothetical protein AAGB46_02165 [Verrucomicrobiota bacterium]
MRKLFFGLMGILGVCCVWGEAQAPLPFEVIASKPCRVQAVKWHEREDGWLITCRLATGNKSLVKPVARLELRGYDPLDEEEGEEGEVSSEGEEAEPEPSWVQQKRVFRKDFDKKVGNMDAQFVRLIVKESIPSSVERLELEFVNEYTK